ncbi:hypothetical protein NQ317_009806, partial [Molorchus minor]
CKILGPLLAGYPSIYPLNSRACMKNAPENLDDNISAQNRCLSPHLNLDWCGLICSQKPHHPNDISLQEVHSRGQSLVFYWHIMATIHSVIYDTHLRLVSQTSPS